MDRDKRARLTRLLWRERLKWFLWPGLIALAIATIYLMLALDSWTPGREMGATFLDLEGNLEPSGGPPTRIIIKTDDGREGLLSGGRHVVFQKGRKIVVREETSSFGRVRYRFVRLADPPD